GGTITGNTLGAGNMIVADGSGYFARNIPTGVNTALYPIGTATNDYTPVTLAFTANAAVGALGIRTVTGHHASDLSATNYLNRYWPFTLVSGFSTYTYTATF